MDPSSAERSRKGDSGEGSGESRRLDGGAEPWLWMVVVPVLDEVTALPGLLAELAAQPAPQAQPAAQPAPPAQPTAQSAPPPEPAAPPDLLARTIFVDNGSSDGSRELLAARGATVVNEPRRGYGYACLTGAGAALARGAGAVAFMEGDGSDDPRDLPLLVGPVLRGEVDLMIGVRGHSSRAAGVRGHSAGGLPARGYGVIRRGMPAHQRLGNRLAAACLRLLFGLEVPDNGPYRAISADLLRRLAMEPRPFAWTTEMLVKAHLAGARIAFVETNYRPRDGRSKIAGSARGTLGAFTGIFVTMIWLWLESRRSR